MTIESTIDLPSCWKDLVETVFPEDLKGIGNGDVVGQDIPVDDPNPYYDDHRLVQNEIAEGVTLTTALTSGQGNYWAKHELYVDPDADSPVDSNISSMETEAFFHFEDEECLEFGDVRFELDINWT